MLEPLELPTWDQRQRTRRANDRALGATLRTLRAHWKTLAGALTALLAVLSFLASTLGIRISWPGDAIAAVAVQQDSLNARVGRLETRDTKIEKTLSFHGYLLCSQSHSADPHIVAQCQQIFFAEQGSAGSIGSVTR